MPKTDKENITLSPKIIILPEQRIVGTMSDMAKNIFKHIEDLITKAQYKPAPAPETQPMPLPQPIELKKPPTVEQLKDLSWMALAKKEIGVTEVPGTANNPRILWYHSFCTLKASYDSVAWCAAFVNAMLITGGIKGTRSAAALDFARWGIELKYAVYGCLAIWDWGNGHGHVGFVIDANDDGLHILGGNQHDAKTDTDKVCIKMFPWSLAPSYFKWPTEIPLPKDAEVDNG
jgi:uncharacterized protein (TIGR02594 family)